MTREFIDFVRTHGNDDTARLLLSAARYPAVDVPAAVQQIEGRRTAREKWPSLLDIEEFLYPPRLNREQASSEETALHKAYVAGRLCGEEGFLTVADLTGGMGVDSIAFAQRTKSASPLRSQVPTHVDYVERSQALCSLMEHNRRALGLENITVHCGDSLEWFQRHTKPLDLVYLDPARRDAAGRKVAAFEDCDPDILRHLDLLRSHCRWLMVKASPMIDIDLACRQLGDVAEVHIISVRGECKEVLFASGPHEGETVIHCVVRRHGTEAFHDCDFTRSEEAAATARYCTAVGRYLYEPDAALMKGGPFRSICHWMDLEKLAPNTHLYTADRLVRGFCGRTFEVLGELKPSRRTVAAALPEGKAHVVVRNYPVEAVALQHRLGLKEGGDLYLVATTVGTRLTAFLCRRAD